MRHWLKYVQPNYLIQERSGVIARYEVWMPQHKLMIGWVEKYVDREQKVMWRSLDHKLSDWRAKFPGREECAQDLVSNCPRSTQRLKSFLERSHMVN